MIRSVTTERRNVPDVMFNGSLKADCAAAKASMLNQHFASCFTSVRPSPVAYAASQVEDVAVPALSDVHCDEDDVLRLLCGIKEGKATGPDGIPGRVLKACAFSASEVLSSLFRISLDSGVLPQEWKISNVVPVFKAGDECQASNYRPISLLSIVSKVLERVVHNSLLSHIEDNSLLSGVQFGFRPGCSTQEALLSVTKCWYEALDRRNSTVAVFLDLSKAFDSLPHGLVLQALERVGVTGNLLVWFRGYLTDRKQRVVLEGESSPLVDVLSGVPQGSILGPLLFILSVDEISAVRFSNSSHVAIWADNIGRWWMSWTW